ncbi:hypothetical protein Tco_0283143 [Tanacetum coccineum]
MYELGFNIRGSTYELGLHIRGSTYEIGLHIRGSTYELGFNIRGSTYELGLHIRGSTYESLLDIRGSTYESGFNIRGSTYELGFHIRGSTWSDTIKLLSARVKEEIVVLRHHEKDYSFGRHYYECLIQSNSTGTDDRGMWLLYVEMTSGSIISSSYGIVNTSKLFSGNFNSSKLFSPDLPDCTNIGKGRVLKW